MYEVSAEYENRLNWKLKNSFKVDTDLKPSDYREYNLYAYKIIENLVELLYNNGFWYEDGKFEVISHIRATKRVNIVNNFRRLYININNEQLMNWKSVNSIPINPYGEFHGKSIEDRNETGIYKYTKEESNIIKYNF
jgi:hypothetical protein